MAAFDDVERLARSARIVFIAKFKRSARAYRIRRLIRRYFPRGTTFKEYSIDDLYDPDSIRLFSSIRMLPYLYIDGILVGDFSTVMHLYHTGELRRVCQCRYLD